MLAVNLEQQLGWLLEWDVRHPDNKLIHVEFCAQHLSALKSVNCLLNSLPLFFSHHQRPVRCNAERRIVSVKVTDCQCLVWSRTEEVLGTSILASLALTNVTNIALEPTWDGIFELIRVVDILAIAVIFPDEKSLEVSSYREPPDFVDNFEQELQWLAE